MNNSNDIAKELEGMGSTLPHRPGMPYAVPEGYFAGFSSELSSAIARDHATVPAGYFEHFPAAALAAAKKADRKTMPLLKHIRLAAAAVLLLCIGAGSYITFENGNTARNSVALPALSANEIQEYLQAAEANEEPAVNTTTAVVNLQADNNDIVEYLNETGWE